MLTSATPDGPELARRTPQRRPEHLTPPDVLGPEARTAARRPAVVPGRDGRHGPGRAGADGDGGRARDRSTQGAGVGATPTRRVRIASSPEEAIDTMEPGDVLVVRATSPAFNAVLAIAGAVVTAEGGPLSHAAVLARRLGIPAVVGALGAAGPHGRCDGRR